MSRISKERKEALVRRYGSKTINTNSGPEGVKPGGHGGRRPGGLGRPGAPRGGMKGSKPKNISATISRLLAYIGRDKVKILFVFTCVLGSSLAGLGGSYILRPVINNLVSAE
jgi:ATP-binding cassette subfamily B multidrug efflux pump